MDLFDRFSRFSHGTFFCAAHIECSIFNIRILNCNSPINNLFENADLHFGILLRTLATGLILPLQQCLSTFFLPFTQIFTLLLFREDIPSIQNLIHNRFRKDRSLKPIKQKSYPTATITVNLRLQRFLPDIYIYSLSSGPLLHTNQTPCYQPDLLRQNRPANFFPTSQT